MLKVVIRTQWLVQEPESQYLLQHYNIQMSFLRNLLCCNDSEPSRTIQAPKPLPNVSKYKQSINQFKNNGIGIYTYDNGDQYDGEWMEGKRHGRGKMIYKNGDFFLGEWVMDKKGGRGFHVYANMDKYEGEWKNDLIDGNGKLICASGSYYQGEFSEGKKDGKGVFYNADNKKKYKQTYKAGALVHKEVVKNHELSPTKTRKSLASFDRPKLTEDDIQMYLDAHPEIQEVAGAQMLYYYGIFRIKGLEFFKSDPKVWTVDNVIEWSHTVGISHSCEEQLRKQKINGKVLLELKNEEAKSDLKMTLGDRKRVFDAVDNLKKHYLAKQVKQPKDKDKQKQDKINHMNNSRLRKRSLTTFYSGKIPNFKIQTNNSIIQQNDENDKDDDDPLPRSSRAKKVESPMRNGTHNHITYTTENMDNYKTMGQPGQAEEHLYESQNVDIIHDNEKDSKNHQLMNLISEQENEKQSSIQEAINMKKNTSKKHSDQQKDPQGDVHDNHKDNKQKSSSSSQTSSSSPSQEQSPRKRRRSRQIKHIQMRQLYEYLRSNHISMKFLIPDNQITNYELIGSGGYGKVFKAKWMSNPVAVKTYIKSGRLHKKSLQNFLQEVGILSDLRHPNIVLYMGMCIQVNKYSLVTEYLEWGSLFELLHKKKRPFNNQQIFNIVQDIILGMVYLHARDVLHRDLKSSNVLMDDDFNVKLCDFGLSEMHTKNNIRSSKARVGTYQWMAPEVLRREKYGFPADVYSFGMIVWEILNQEIPYQNMSQPQIVGTVGYDEGYKIRQPHQGQAYLIDIMYDCLKYHPEDRPTFKQIQERLQSMKKQMQITRASLKKEKDENAQDKYLEEAKEVQ